MAVTKEEVLRIASLARLAMDEEQAERFTTQLNEILSHVEALRAGEQMRGEAPLSMEASVPSLLDPMPAPREDEVGADPLAHPPAAFAPLWDDGFFVVPRLAALDADAGAGEPGG